MWLLSWSIVTLVVGYFATPNLWYINTVAEFFISFAKVTLTNKKVKEIIFLCVKRKYEEILFITGKGIHSSVGEDVYASKDFNKLKFSVPEFIKSDNELNKLIISIKTAETKDGGEGAIIIKLKDL